MTIYVYKSTSNDLPGWLGVVLGVRYWAYDAEWPYGRMLAGGSTPHGAARKAARKLARKRNERRIKIELVLTTTDHGEAKTDEGQ